MVFNRFRFLKHRLTTTTALGDAMARLSDEEVKSALGSLTGWHREGDYITKEFHFDTYLGGIRFVDKVALVAEAQEHHPDVHVIWTTVTLKIQTHDEGGITKWDIALAKEIEKKVVAPGKKSSKPAKSPR
jgi:4a-hydroxytetrahydrobiopterin dehydratase